MQVLTSVKKNAAVMYRQSDLTYTPGRTRLASMCYNRSLPAIYARDPESITPRGPPVSRDAKCNLGVIIDHTFYQEIAQSNTAMAVSIVTQHIAQADFIFRMTDMDLDGLPNNIGFEISNIKIYETVDAADYRLTDMSLRKQDLMNQFSSYNFNNYCLAVGFFCREFGQLLFNFPPYYYRHSQRKCRGAPQRSKIPSKFAQLAKFLVPFPEKF